MLMLKTLLLLVCLILCVSVEARESVCSFVGGSGRRQPSQLNVDSNSASSVDGKSNDSLSYWMSTPERYAERLGLTVEQVQAKKQLHQAASQALHERLSVLTDGNLKHQLACEHRYRNGKHPFVCHQCWSYLPICLCSEAARQPKISLPKNVNRVVLWTHHREWTSISNSGSLLPLMLQDTQLFMKGLPDHEQHLEPIFDNPDSRVVVLWPDNDTTKGKEENASLHNRITWQELQQIVKVGSNDPPITLVALEGTWRTARRMASKLPNHVQRVAITPEVAFWNNPSSNQKSLLQPLRKQEGGSQDNICTAEAVTAALVGLGMPKKDGKAILGMVQRKVDQTRRYQGKRKRN